MSPGTTRVVAYVGGPVARAGTGVIPGSTLGVGLWRVCVRFLTSGESMGFLSAVTNTAPSMPSRVVFYASEKSGKCLAKGTMVLMYDGTTVAVENVREGDVLMGPDSKPRRVRELHNSTGPLYRVNQSDGTSYVVNERHILSLRRDNEKRCAGKEVVNVPVNEFLTWDEKKQFHHRGYRVGVEWPEQVDLPIPPYLFGCWLGDGTASKPDITTPDKEVVAAMNKYATERGMVVNFAANAGLAQTLRITHGKPQKNSPNEFTDSLRFLGVFNNKHIPHAYKTGSRSQRLELLAGIVDSDGSMEGRRIVLMSSSEVLARDVEFVARSLGFRAFTKPRQKTCTNAVGKPRRTYWQTVISGDVNVIPTRVARRRDEKPRQFYKDVRTCRVSITPEGEGEFYGFEVGGDHLFLLGDFTVTHNTSFACHSPRPIFLMTSGETGLRSLIAAGQVPPTDHFPNDFQDFGSLRQAVMELVREKHDFKTLVLDTGNGAEKMCAQEVCDTEFNGNWSSYQEYGRGVRIAEPAWGQFLGLLDTLRVKRGMGIIFLHHAAVKAVSNPTGKDWDQHRPEAIDKMWGLTHKWADVIAYYGTKVNVGKDDKAQGETRFLRCNPSAAIVAGNRYGMPDEITAPPGAKHLWDAFAKSLIAAKAKGKTQEMKTEVVTEPAATEPAPQQQPADASVFG